MNSIMKSKLKVEDFDGIEQIADKIWVSKSTMMNGLGRSIYRYMSFEHLLSMLSNQELYVSNRKNFSDRRESGAIFDLKTDLTLNIVEKNKRIEGQRRKKYSRVREAAKSICISCWTFGNINQINNGANEDYLMWKSYNKENVTCRIQTTIEDLIHCLLPQDNYDIIISDVSYSNMIIESTNNYIFNKSVYYYSENELRVCVLSENDYVKLRINPFEFIKGIIISPFISKEYSLFLSNQLKSIYSDWDTPIMISKIIENE